MALSTVLQIYCAHWVSAESAFALLLQTRLQVRNVIEVYVHPAAHALRCVCINKRFVGIQHPTVHT